MKYLLITISLVALFSCSSYNSEQNVSESINIYPDYDSVVIPRSIAPLNFMVTEDGDSYIFEFYNPSSGKELLKIESGDGNCIIPFEKWKEMVSDLSLKDVEIKIGVVNNKIRYNYNPISITISDDQIEGYIAYRSIEPGYEYWGRMGLYQRDLSTFDEYAIVENRLEGKGMCVNCHSFCNNSADRFMFHSRKVNHGTYISIDGKVEKFSTKVGSMIGDAVYPSWHPNGRYIAFSTNVTRQLFHNSGEKPIEVFDNESDIVVYDTQENVMFSSSLLYDKTKAESFPWWSRDGKHLYFISTPQQPLDSVDALSLKYNLYRVAFNANSKEFSDYELLIDADSLGRSVTMPRTYHDDTKVSFAMCDYGSFSIWHDNSDIYSLDLESRELESLDVLNSDKSESYRSFSTSGNWVIFSSRRDDGLFTRLYISHYDKQNETFSKPFMLPQAKAILNMYNEKSFNIPEFVDRKIEAQSQIQSALDKDAKKISTGKQLF
ncbi:MAG: hypothetical protein R3Y51_06930 [Rikenellaceae bacterium]